MSHVRTMAVSATDMCMCRSTTGCSTAKGRVGSTSRCWSGPFSYAFASGNLRQGLTHTLLNTRHHKPQRMREAERGTWENRTTTPFCSLSMQATASTSTRGRALVHTALTNQPGTPPPLTCCDERYGDPSMGEEFGWADRAGTTNSSQKLRTNEAFRSGLSQSTVFFVFGGGRARLFLFKFAKKSRASSNLL